MKHCCCWILLGSLSTTTTDALSLQQQTWSTKTGPSSTVIVGGGPTGLATAWALSQRGWENVKVIDKGGPPRDVRDPARFYLIGIGGRGQMAMRKLGVWDAVSEKCTKVVARQDWPPGAGPDDGVLREYTDRPYKTHVLTRDRLAGAFYDLLLEKTNVTFSWHCEFDQFAHEKNIIALSSGGGEETLPAELVIGADGAARMVARAADLKVRRYDDDNARVFKSVLLKLPPKWRGDVNYSARSKDGRLNFDALPATKENEYCGVLLLKESDELAKANTSETKLRKLLDDYLPQFSPFIDDQTLKNVAKAPPNPLPRFRYIDDHLHRDDNLVFLGDAAHTVKPYFGLGASSALEDVVALRDAISSESHGTNALEKFSKLRQPEAKALVQISRGLDRPGLIGFITFVLPLLLDLLFHRFLPRIFATNAIALMQQDITFKQVQRRKRQDRLLQLVVLSGLAYGLFHLAKLTFVSLVSVSLRLFHSSLPTETRLALTSAAAFLVTLGTWRFFVNTKSPADLLARINLDSFSWRRLLPWQRKTSSSDGL